MAGVSWPMRGGVDATVLLVVSGASLAASAEAVDRSTACAPAATVFEASQMVLPDVRVEAAALGPRIAAYPRIGLRRATSEVESRINDEQAALTACYRWARWKHPALEGTIAAHFRIDEWGAVRGLSMKPENPMAGTAALERCVLGVLTPMALNAYTPRLTDVATHLFFRRSGQQRPHRRPALPRLTSAAAQPRMCVEVPAMVPVDRLDVPKVVVDDYSPEQARAEELAEYERAYRRWKAGGSQGKPPTRPTDIIGCACPVGASMDARMVGRVVSYDEGAYGACAIAARTRLGTDVTGRVVIDVDIESTGHFRRARARQPHAGDAELARCLALAVEELWVVAPASRRGWHAMVPFVLGAAASRAPEEPLAPEQPVCTGLTSLRAAVKGAPWLDDARVTAAVESFARDVAAHPGDPVLARCWSSAKDLLQSIAMNPHRDAQTTQRWALYERAVEQYRWLLGLPARIPGAGEMTFYAAEALFKLERWRDAAALYSAVAPGAVSPRIAREATYAAVIAWKNALAIDDDAIPPRETTIPVEDVRALVAAYDAYLVRVPDAPEREQLQKSRQLLEQRLAGP